MRTIFLVLAAAILVSCGDGPETLGICELVSCADAELLVETRVTDLAGRAPTEPLAPGDTFVVHRRIENLRDTSSDSLFLALYARRVEDRDRLFYTYPIVERNVDSLAPRQVIELTDTVQVPRFTFTRQFDLLMAAQEWTSPHRSPKVMQDGDSTLSVLRSGYEIEIVAIPEQVHDGRRQFTQLRHYAQAGALLRIRNPYDLPLDSLRLDVCVFDIDYCAVSDSSSLVPRVAPGAETYFDFNFLVDTREGPRDWWGRFDGGLRFCGEGISGIFSRRCVSVPVRVLANFEETCDVVTVTPGVLYTDAVSECPKQQPLERFNRGSAFRFEARAGERYRIEFVGSGPSSQWFSDRNGVPETASPMIETTIPSDGTYYIAVQHRSPIQFRLIRTQ